MKENIWYLCLGHGMYEDYREDAIFYGSKEFISEKLEEWNKKLEEAENKLVAKKSKNIQDIIDRYCSIMLKIPIFWSGGIILGMSEVKSYENFLKSHESHESHESR